MANKIYACDVSGFCPYEAQYGATCRNMCGLGVDENDIDTEEDSDEEVETDETVEAEVDESVNPYDGTQDWENDRYEIGES